MPIKICSSFVSRYKHALLIYFYHIDWNCKDLIRRMLRYSTVFVVIHSSICLLIQLQQPYFVCPLTIPYCSKISEDLIFAIVRFSVAFVWDPLPFFFSSSVLLSLCRLSLFFLTYIFSVISLKKRPTAYLYFIILLTHNFSPKAMLYSLITHS